MLHKIFNFKGLYQSGRKQDAPLGSFRRLTNTYKDKSGRLVPCGRQTLSQYYKSSLGLDSLFSVKWKNSVFSGVAHNDFGTERVEFSKYNLDDNSLGDVVQPFRKDSYSNYSSNSLTHMPAGNFTSCTIREKIYFLDSYKPEDFYGEGNTPLGEHVVCNLMKFDGYKTSRAGLPTPYNVFPINTGGNAQVRTVYMTVGMDGEVIFSNYLQHKFTKAAVSTADLGGYDGSFNRRVDPIKTLGVIPTRREANDSLYDFSYPGVFGEVDNFYDRRYAVGTGSFTLNGYGELQINYSYSSNLNIGDWLMCWPFQNPQTTWDGFYLKIIARDATTITFSKKLKGYNSFTFGWEDIDLDAGQPTDFATMSAFLSALSLSPIMSNIWSINSVSNIADGSLPYYVASIQPICWDSNTLRTIATDVVLPTFTRPLFGIITNDMAGWYQHTEVKLPFPNTIKGITNFTDLLVAFDDNALYFSDVSFGGSTEMTSGLSNLIPTGSEFGKIVAICASEDFIFISRERKNFVLRGEISTGNVNIVECDQAVTSAYNARAVTNSFIGRVLFMNETGAYSVGPQGELKDISMDIKDLFLDRSPDGNLFDPKFFQKPSALRANPFDGGIIDISLDDYRGFVFFLTGRRNELNVTPKYLVTPNILVFDTTDESWYEWTTSGTTATAFEGKEYFWGSLLTVEDPVVRGDEQVIATQWITLGEPALDKQITQINFYGKLIKRPGVYVNSQGVNIRQQNNWEPFSGTNNTDVYYPQDKDRAELKDAYLHNQRLNSSKAKVTSLIFMDSNNVWADGGGGIELEGIELEILGVQEGAKKAVSRVQ